MLTLHWNKERALPCLSVILTPEIALRESGHIQMFSTNKGPQVKQEYYALSQTALVRFQDRDLEITEVDGPLRLEMENDTCVLDNGMAICRTPSGDLKVFSHGGASHRKLIDAAHRYCTRWIRLNL